MNNNYTSERPGIYVKFRGVSKANVLENGRGIVAMPLMLNYGPSNTFAEINLDTGTSEIFGYSLSDALFPLVEAKKTQLFFVGEALKKAHTVLLYRLGGGTKAAVTVGEFTATAKYEGSRGNDFAFKITKNGELYDVETFVEGRPVHKQTVETAAELKNNAHLDFSGESLAEAALTYLKDGADNALSNADYDLFFAAAAKKYYNTTCYVGDATEVKNAFLRFVQSERDTEGKFVSCVLSKALFDYEGVISLANGVVLANGDVLTSAYATAYVAGAAAAATDYESLTYAKYMGAADVCDVLTSSETAAALRSGSFVFSNVQGEVVIEKDINSLVSFSAERPEVFSKNRVLRVLDTVATDIKAMCKRLVIGKLSNNADGRGILKSSIVSYLQEKVKKGAIAGFDAVTDVRVTVGATSDTIAVEIAVVPIDAVEKIFMTLSIE